MIEQFKNLFVNNWERKCVSFLLSIILWLMVSHQQLTTKTLEGVAIRLVNVPPGLAVQGRDPSGILARRITLTLQGKKEALEEITAHDLEVVMDATNKSGNWNVLITKNNLVSLNPALNLSRAISRVIPCKETFHFSQMVTEKIPVTLTHPLGTPPMDYQFLDLWPHVLYLTLSGPKETISELKDRGLTLTLNLNDVSYADLEALRTHGDEVTFPVPDEWKRISIPALSETPFEIDDPNAAYLELSFLKASLHPVINAIPLHLFCPYLPGYTLDPEPIVLEPSRYIQKIQNTFVLHKNLYAKGVSRLFVEVVQNRIQIVLIPNPEHTHFDWSVQFIGQNDLEDRYVSLLLSTPGEHEREELLRNRFRNYVHRFELVSADDQPLQLFFSPQGNHLQIEVR